MILKIKFLTRIYLLSTKLYQNPFLHFMMMFLPFIYSKLWRYRKETLEERVQQVHSDQYPNSMFSDMILFCKQTNRNWQMAAWKRELRFSLLFKWQHRHNILPCQLCQRFTCTESSQSYEQYRHFVKTSMYSISKNILVSRGWHFTLVNHILLTTRVQNPTWYKRPLNLLSCFVIMLFPASKYLLTGEKMSLVTQVSALSLQIILH